jgi:hypothetical protein
MRNSITRFALALAAALALTSTAAQAKPFVTVKVGVPTVLVAPPPVVVVPRAVVVRPASPGPNYVWIEPHWRSDAYGRRMYVAGHWAHRPRTVVVRPAPRVVVHHRR